MVLRFILIALLSSSLVTPAMALSTKKAFSLAKRLTKARKHQKSQRILNRVFGAGRLDSSLPVGVLILAGENYYHLGLMKKAAKAYNVVLRRKLARKHKKTWRKYQKDKSADDIEDIGLALSMTYNFVAIMEMEKYIAIYRRDRNDNALIKLFERIKFYAEVLLSVEYNDEVIEKKYEEIQRLHTLREKLRFKHSYYALYSIVSWRDKLKLNFEDGTEVDAFATQVGNCIGGGYRKYNLRWSYNFSACLLAGIGNVKGDATATLADGSTVDYTQNNIPTFGIMLTPGAQWKPGEKSSFGMSFPLLFRTGDYEQPSGVNEVSGTTIVSVGYLLETEWELTEATSLDFKFGQIFGLSSSIAMFEFHYYFY